MLRYILFSFLLAQTSILSANSVQDRAIYGQIDKINSLREVLVKSMPTDKKPTLETFKRTCKPVGITAKKVSKANGWKFRQVSHKNRNPKNKPNAREARALAKFAADSKLTRFSETSDGITHYYQRITVQQNCTQCHGTSEDRPDFIKKKYPKDKAINFKAGDLRGMYAVSVKNK